MTRKMYLVTEEAERHEDHIPMGVFTWKGFKKHFPNISSEEDFIPNEWNEVYCLAEWIVSNDPSYYDKYGGIANITKDKASWDKFCLAVSGGVKGIENWDGQYRAYNVIQISLNKRMKYT